MEYTTKECQFCHASHTATLSEMTFLCPRCRCIAPRDFKAIITVLRRALLGMGMFEFTS
ncbi:MAG: transposase [Nitrososphaerota archaeon]|nr:transposase [Nitrososphaerota archaeon]